MPSTGYQPMEFLSETQSVQVPMRLEGRALPPLAGPRACIGSSVTRSTGE